MANRGMTLKPVIAGLLLLCCISGCVATKAGDTSGRGCYQNLNQLLEHTELKKIFADIAIEMCKERCDGCAEPLKTGCGSGGTAESPAPESPPQTVLVTDFVDLQSFIPHQQGLLMGELMRGSLNSQCCYRIVQAEFSRFFTLSEKGLVVLSRKAADIKNDTYSQPECIVGTYSFMNNKLIIFVRRINTVTGKISKIVMREIDYRCVGNQVTYQVK